MKVFRLIFLSLLAGGLSLSYPLRADSVRVEENALKAAFTIKFLGFVEMPEKDLSTTICVVGSPEMSTAFEVFEGRRIKNGRVRIVRLRSLKESLPCSVVFLAADRKERWSLDMAAVKENSVLTVSDAADFLDQGGIIQLEKKGKTLGFRIDLALARSLGLDFDSKLLRLAIEVLQER